MANWWEQYQLAPQNDVTSTGFGSAPMPAPQQAQAPAPAPVPPQGAPAAPRFLTPQPQTMGGLFAGLPREALMIAGLSGPESGIKFLAPFMTQSPIEVMTPNGPMFMSPWQARGMPSPGTMLGFRKDDRDERQFGASRQDRAFDEKLRLGQFGLEAQRDAQSRANAGVVIGQDGQPVINPFPSRAASTTEIEKGSAERILKNADAARAAVTGINSIHEGRKLLDQGAVTGWGADFRVGFGSALRTLGIDNGDPIANTQAYGAAMAQQVFATIKNLGAGSGISDADRRFAEQATGRDYQFTEEALRKILDIGERASRRAIQSHMDRVKPFLDSGTLSPGAASELTVAPPPEYAPPPRQTPQPPATPPGSQPKPKPWERFK